MNTKSLITSLFKAHGQPFVPYPFQVDIFEEIYLQRHNLVHCILPTQAGKSSIVAPAVLLRSLVFAEDFVIVAPSEPKAQIIMNYVRNHCFDNAFFSSQLELDENESLDRLRKERSRKKITWKHGGSVRVLSVNARQADNPEAVMGEGAPKIVIDESSLVPDLHYSTIMRMTQGFPFEKTQVFEIGNPFYRNHFYRTSLDPDYHHICYDWHDMVAQGRFDESRIEKARELPLFDIFYECKFPDENEIDPEGFRQLVTSQKLDWAQVSAMPRPDNLSGDDIMMGVDVGGGGDDTVIVLRNEGFAWEVLRAKTTDTMCVVAQIEELADKWRVDQVNIFIDDIGVGRGVCDRLKEKGKRVNGVSVGDRPITDEGKARYFNIKAENYLNLASWLEAGGKLVQNRAWEQLTWIKYKVNSDKNVQIERKEKLKARVGRSPDTAEALMLTFTKKRPQPRSWVI